MSLKKVLMSIFGAFAVTVGAMFGFKNKEGVENLQHGVSFVEFLDKKAFEQRVNHYLKQWKKIIYKSKCPSNYYFYKGIVSAILHENESMEKYFNCSKNDLY